MHTSKKPIKRDIASMPDSPVTRMTIPEPLKHNQRIRDVNRKISGGAVNNTQAGNNVLCLIVAAELIIIAIVPGPAVLGMASGMKAKLVFYCVALLEEEG
jgi:hypothetical protein